MDGQQGKRIYMHVPRLPSDIANVIHMMHVLPNGLQGNKDAAIMAIVQTLMHWMDM